MQRNVLSSKESARPCILQNNKTATEVICSRTPSQIQHLRPLYHSMFGTYLDHDIELQLTGDHQKELHKAMKGFGTDDSTLTRIIVTRAEIDMQYIKAEYHKKHGRTLNDAVHSETSSHFKAFLLALLGPNHH